jgi:hypothetical protein
LDELFLLLASCSIIAQLLLEKSILIRVIRHGDPLPYCLQMVKLGCLAVEFQISEEASLGLVGRLLDLLEGILKECLVVD